MRTRISRLLRSLFARPGKNRRIPVLESLETRVTPSVTWDNNAEDGHIVITAGESVAVGSTDNHKLRILVNGADLANPPQQAASSILRLTITATNGLPNLIDLSGINTATEFTQLTTVLVNLDGKDTVNHAGWAPACAETTNGQRFLDFTMGRATLKVTDVGGIAATLVRKKMHHKSRLFVHVSFASTGETKQEFPSPFQPPKFRGVNVSVVARNGNGIPDTVVVTARRGHKTVTRQFPG